MRETCICRVILGLIGMVEAGAEACGGGVCPH